MRPRLLAALVAGLAVATAVVVLAWPRPEGRLIEVVVPPGTMERVEAGEQVELLPRRLEVSVGDRLLIVNEDLATHLVGPYIVGPGQRLEQRFGRPGTISGLCTLHPSGQVSIVVR